MKKIVITGASGFLGLHLLKRFKDDSRYRVAALTSKPEELERLTGGSNIVCFPGDALFQTGTAADILTDSVVIHCAFPRGKSEQERRSGMDYLKDLLIACRLCPPRAFIDISSQSVYDAKRTEAARETDPVMLDSVYAALKYSAELMTECAFSGTKTAYTNLRMASLIGPGFDIRIVNRFLLTAMNEGRLCVKKNSQRFGFFDVEDAVSGIFVMLESDERKWKPVYNLGGAGAFSLEEIAEAVRDAVRKIRPVEIITENDEKSGSSALDAGLFYEEFGFCPAYDLEKSIQKILASLRNDS